MQVAGTLSKVTECKLLLMTGFLRVVLISRKFDFNLKITLASAKRFTKSSDSLWKKQVPNFALLFGGNFII